MTGVQTCALPIFDFYEHWPKKFVTSMLEAELVAEAPVRPRKPRSTAARPAARKPGASR